MRTIDCEQCGESVMAQRSTRRFCSTQCRDSARVPRGERKRNPDTSRAYHLKYYFNMTVEEWEAMFDAQGRKCYFGCETTTGKNWSTDHDHACCPGKRTCGKCVRAILCQRHNHLIGWIETSRSELADAEMYIETFKESI